MSPNPQFAAGRHRQLLGLPNTRQRPCLRAWVCCYVRTLCQLDPAAVRPTAELPGVALARNTHTFHQLEPATGHWRRL